MIACMAHAKTYGAQIQGLETHVVTIEVDTSNGLHSFSVVGLGDKAVDESRDRVSSAIKNSGYQSPKQKNQKLIISLAPADMRKEGPAFDLGMALAYLLACGDIDFDPEGKLFLGELALDGSVRKVHGVLPMVKASVLLGFSEVFIPSENALEAGLVRGMRIYPVGSLEEIIGHLEERKGYGLMPIPKTEIGNGAPRIDIDMSVIRGQESAKRGLEIAAAGGHNIALYGPPGTGKTMLAKAFRGILPPLTENEILEATAIHSIAKTLGRDIITEPPFRAPHHTASYASLVGGGALPRPGEITLAHRGVLFLVYVSQNTINLDPFPFIYLPSQSFCFFCLMVKDLIEYRLKNVICVHNIIDHQTSNMTGVITKPFYSIKQFLKFRELTWN